MDALTDGEFYWQITERRKPMPGFEDKLTIDRALASGGLYPHLRAAPPPQTPKPPTLKRPDNGFAPAA